MTKTQDIRAEAEGLLAAFVKAGAEVVDLPVLLPADTLLDLYGEDIRARAYTTDDPDRGELMLRPDFTVPVVEMHLNRAYAASGGQQDSARYSYLGDVFRKQPAGTDRPTEYLQLGYERFDQAGASDGIAADVEVFSLFSRLLGDLGLRAVTGDMGILRAAVACLDTSPARKAALRRHLSRPRRFQALLDRFTGRAAPVPGRADQLADLEARPAEAIIAEAGVQIGARRVGDVVDRVARLRDDASAPLVSRTEADVLASILKLRAPLHEAREHLRDMVVDLPGLADAVETFIKRCAALDASGVDLSALEFEASFGRTTMEYYDGFVFGFLAESRPDLPPVATGGRYDSLTRALGSGVGISAVGGVIRPGLVHDLRQTPEMGR